ncbi:MAG: 7-carboxy-7-deazaguanine synthase QueE [Gemmataceae bacterium]|nr:7-carboxy-7-deazaguanine synthase QueE [Gemmataceae bacterium]
MSAAEKSHRIRLLEGLPAGSLLIHEIYRSLQGESLYAGLPCVFVRLAVCDARCVWCDTPHAFSQGVRQPLDEVLAAALAYNTPVVEVTGGEPLLQPDVFPLMTRLADAGKKVLLETSGAHDLAPVDGRVHIIMDLKCPDSGECDDNRWENLDILKSTDEVKFVVASTVDWQWTEHVIREHRLQERLTVQVSGVFGKIRPHELAEWILRSGLNIRLQVQLHKMIWDPQARGV